MGSPGDRQGLTKMQTWVSMPQSNTERSCGRPSSSFCKVGTMLKHVLLTGLMP